MQALEWLKQPVFQAGIESRSVVTHEERCPSASFFTAKLNMSVLLLRGIFPCVSHQIFQGNSQQARIPFYRFAVMDEELDISLRLASTELVED
jgi:hypothetical protein